MDKVGYPRGLIRYSSENALREHLSFGSMIRRVVRPRVLVYAVVLWLIIIGAAVTLYHRVPVKVDVIRDRVGSSLDQESGEVENIYRLQIMNTSEMTRRFEVSASGLQDMKIEGNAGPFEVGPASSRMIPVRLEAHRDHAHKGANPIVFTVKTIGETEAIVVTEKASFIVQ